MKTIILPFSCIKAHYEGDIFAPVEVAAGVWELQSATRVMAGSNGTIYHFTSAQNASNWVDNNLIRASKQKTTRIEIVNKLKAKHAANPQPWLAEEIAVLEARNAGEWGIVLGDPITGEWEIYPQGVSADENNALILGQDGKPFYAEPAAGGGVVYSEWFDVTPRNNGINSITQAHGLGKLPEGLHVRARVDVALNGYSVGDIIPAECNRNLFWMAHGFKFDAVNMIVSANIGANINAVHYRTTRPLDGADANWARNQLTIQARAWASI